MINYIKWGSTFLILSGIFLTKKGYTQYPLIKNTFIKNDWLNTKVLKNRHQSILNEIKNTFLSQTSQNFQLKERHLCFKNIHKFVSRNIFFLLFSSYYYWQKNPNHQFCCTSRDNFELLLLVEKPLSSILFYLRG